MPRKQQVDLTQLFGTVTQALAENRSTLNQLDQYNRNHGDNMVQTFATITQALEQKQGASKSSALRYAARQVARNANSTSSQIYAQHLEQAADRFKGRRTMDERGAMELLQTLIGSGAGGQAAAGAGAQGLADLLGSLNSGASPAQPASQLGGGDDMLGSLLGGLLGGQTGGSQPSQGGQAQTGFGLQNLLNAGMAYMQAKQQGGSNMQSLVQAFIAGSSMGTSAHREQSTALVVQSFLQALQGTSGR